MNTVFVVRDQNGLFASKHMEWLDGREPKLLFRSPHHDEAINMVFEMSSKDIYVRASAIEVSLGDNKQPIVEVTAPLPEPEGEAVSEDETIPESVNSQQSSELAESPTSTELIEPQKKSEQTELSTQNESSVEPQQPSEITEPLSSVERIEPQKTEPTAQTEVVEPQEPSEITESLSSVERIEPQKTEPTAQTEAIEPQEPSEITESLSSVELMKSLASSDAVEQCSTTESTISQEELAQKELQDSEPEENTNIFQF